MGGSFLEIFGNGAPGTGEADGDGDSGEAPGERTDVLPRPGDGLRKLGELQLGGATSERPFMPGHPGDVMPGHADGFGERPEGQFLPPGVG